MSSKTFNMTKEELDEYLANPPDLEDCENEDWTDTDLDSFKGCYAYENKDKQENLMAMQNVCKKIRAAALNITRTYRGFEATQEFGTIASGIQILEENLEIMFKESK